MKQNTQANALNTIADRIRADFTEKNGLRDQALHRSREVIRYCANAIRAVHREEFSEARKLLKDAAVILTEVERSLEGHGAILHAGYVGDAQKEYAEACITLACVSGKAIPQPEELRVWFPSYLNGMGEAIGELCRHLLDKLRSDDLSQCEEMLDLMDAMYNILVTMDFPEAITGGLRRTTDNARGILERTRADFTTAIRQRHLEERLKELEHKLP